MVSNLGNRSKQLLLHLGYFNSSSETTVPGESRPTSWIELGPLWLQGRPHDHIHKISIPLPLSPLQRIALKETNLYFYTLFIWGNLEFVSSTGRRPASLCHGPVSVVRPCVRPCVNFFFKHLLRWNYLSDFDEISQKCSHHGPLQNFWNNLIPSKTLVAMATKLKIFWNLWKSSCQKP